MKAGFPNPGFENSQIKLRMYKRGKRTNLFTSCLQNRNREEKKQFLRDAAADVDYTLLLHPLSLSPCFSVMTNMGVDEFCFKRVVRLH